MRSQHSLMEISKYLEVAVLLKLQAVSHRFYDTIVPMTMTAM